MRQRLSLWLRWPRHHGPGNFDRRPREHGRSVSPRVLKVNPAKALYDRLGFIVVGDDAATYEMRARP